MDLSQIVEDVADALVEIDRHQCRSSSFNLVSGACQVPNTLRQSTPIRSRPRGDAGRFRRLTG
jgi:hypothetical protein